MSTELLTEITLALKYPSEAEIALGRRRGSGVFEGLLEGPEEHKTGIQLFTNNNIPVVSQHYLVNSGETLQKMVTEDFFVRDTIAHAVRFPRGPNVDFNARYTRDTQTPAYIEFGDAVDRFALYYDTGDGWILETEPVPKTWEVMVRNPDWVCHVRQVSGAIEIEYSENYVEALGGARLSTVMFRNPFDTGAFLSYAELLKGTLERWEKNARKAPALDRPQGAGYEAFSAVRDAFFPVRPSFTFYPKS